MGSGCISGSSAGGSSSVLFQKKTPDTMVQYTGDSIPGLGICKGDLLSEVESVILQHIVDYSTGVGICIPDIDLTACALFADSVSGCCTADCHQLDDLMIIIFDSLCSIYTDVETLKTEFAALNTGYITSCLSGVTVNSTLKDVLQELITEFCTLKSDVATLTTTVATLGAGIPAQIGDFLRTALQSCQAGPLTKSGTGASFTATFSGFTPVGGIIMYSGPLSDFDGTGLGRPNTPMCGWALCNGNTQNGILTVDMRGYKPVGVNDGSMFGGAQNTEVDNAINPGQAYSVNAHGGVIRYQLSSTESGTAAHTHAITDPGHDHVLQFENRVMRKTGGGGDNYVDLTGPVGANTSSPSTGITSNPSIVDGYIRQNFTGISLAAYGGSAAATAHENRDPYRALYFIQRVA